VVRIISTHSLLGWDAEDREIDGIAYERDSPLDALGGCLTNAELLERLGPLPLLDSTGYDVLEPGDTDA
jgi:hypothetical protein